LVACSKKDAAPTAVTSAAPITPASSNAPQDDNVHAAWNAYKAARASISFPGPITVIWVAPDKTTFKVAGKLGDVALRADAVEALAPEMANQQKTHDDHSHDAAKEGAGDARISIKP